MEGVVKMKLTHFEFEVGIDSLQQGLITENVKLKATVNRIKKIYGGDEFGI